MADAHRIVLTALALAALVAVIALPWLFDRRRRTSAARSIEPTQPWPVSAPTARWHEPALVDAVPLHIATTPQVTYEPCAPSDHNASELDSCNTDVSGSDD